MQWLESARSSWDVIEAQQQPDGFIRVFDAVVAAYRLGLRASALSYTMHQDDVWPSSRRDGVEAYLQGRPGAHPTGTIAKARHHVFASTEDAAKAAGDQVVAEWHLAQALADSYPGPDGLQRLGIDAARLVARVRQRENENGVLTPPRPKPDWGTRWQRIRDLDRGGQANTFVVSDLDDPIGRQYALKELKNAKRLDRFRNEIEAIHKIEHRNVIELVDFNVEARRPYLVMPFCGRGNLANVPAWQRRSPEYAVDILLGIAAGLAAAHLAGVVHRDIKPENILIGDDGHALVADFGIAFLDEGERVTTMFEVAASRWFGAPELGHGRIDQVAPAADVYSLGKLLHWMFIDRPMDREHFEEGDWNVALIIGERDGEHVNRFLRQTIVERVEGRLPDARAVERELIKLRKLIQGRFNAVAPGVGQLCTYCGIGVYRPIANENVDELGVHRVAGGVVGRTPDWRGFVCQDCGHIQLFRADAAAQRHWWDSH